MRAFARRAAGPVLGRLAGLRRPVSWGRPVSRALLAVAGVLTGLVMLALAGAAVDDAAINAGTGRATAQVLAVTSARTLVQFAGPDGQVYSPDEGVAYPSGLRVGQLVRVEYNSADPEQVRVAGRTWIRGLLPAAITLVVVWVCAGALAIVCRRWVAQSRRPSVTA